MRTFRRLVFLAVAVVPVAIAAACGGSSNDTPAPDASIESGPDARRDAAVIIDDEPRDAGARDSQTRDSAPPPPFCPTPIPCTDAGAGGPITLSRTVNADVGGLAADGCNVYWNEVDPTGSSATVKSVPRCGGAVTTIASGQPYPALGVTQDAWWVYWTGRGVIRRAPKGGGSIQTLATVSGQDPWAIAVDDAFVYWTDNGSASRVYRVSLSGGAPTEIAFNGPGSAYGMALSGDRLYFAGLQIRSARKDGTDLVDLGGSGLHGLWCIGVDATDIYYTNYSDNVVMRLPKTGGDASVFAQTAAPRCLAVGGGHVYWGTDVSGVMRAPTDGGAPVDISGGTAGTFVTLDDTFAYWGLGGRVERAPR